MITRSDLNESAFEQLIRNELLEQLSDLEFSMNDDSIRDTKLVEAFKRVIAYNSVPGTYEDGKYDQ
jgi:HEAT repeat protein